MAHLAPFLDRLRWRALALYGLRAALVTTAAAVVGHGAGAWAIGPAPRSVAVWAVWALTVALALAALLAAAAPLWRNRGPGVTRWIVPRDPSLASRVASALEFHAGGRALTGSPALAAAHVAAVREALEPLSAGPFLPLRATVERWVIAVVAGAALALLVLGTLDRARAGSFALLHAGETDARGNPVVLVVERVRVSVRAPAHWGRPDQILALPRVVEAPEGSVLSVEFHPRLEAEAAWLSVGGRRVDAHKAGAGFQAAFVADTEGPLEFIVQAGERALRDGVERRIAVVRDAPPSARWTRPTTDLVIEPGDTVPLAYLAADDLGLRHVDLLAKVPGREVLRRPLVRREGTPQRTAQGETHFLPEEAGALPGDAISLWIEVTDNNAVRGSQLARSAVRTLRVASEATRRAADIESLAALLERGLDALADELERGTEADDRRPRQAEFGEALRSFRQRQRSGATEGVLRELGRRLGALLAAVAPKGPADAKLTDALERAVLLVSDFTDDARLRDAAALAKELEAMRREMATLVDRIARDGSEADRAALAATMERAKSKLADLGRRLGELARDVPSDFVNVEALEREARPDALDGVERAVAAGDLEAAREGLLEFERRLDALAGAFGSGAEAFEAGRMGPRQRALKEAMEALRGLEADQRQLADRSSTAKTAAAESALRSSGRTPSGANPELSRRARALAERARSLAAERGRTRDPEDRAAEAAERLKDVSALAEAGDAAEAHAMSAEAAMALDALARDLSIESLMFPGHTGDRATLSKKAEALAKEARDLEDAALRALPDLAEHLPQDARERLAGDAPRQGELAGKTRRLSEAFQQGPDGQPLDPQAADALRAAAERMGDARGALGRADVVGASRAQQDAAKALAELRQRLEQASPDNDSGSGDGTDGPSEPEERVVIPVRGEAADGDDLRRALLDGMREAPPESLLDAARRYYQGLLR